MLVFGERGNPNYNEIKPLSVQNWNPGHTGGKLALLPLRQL